MNETLVRTGFRPLRVTARRQETARVTSFFLEPVEPGDWRDFQAGQFLSFRLPSTDARGKMLRNYSLASSPLEKGRYQICVKRDSASSGAQAGQGSGYFHDTVHEGDILHADGPRGNFILKDSPQSALLISGDIGVTPLVAMLRVLAARNHPLTFIHECDDAPSHILRDDIAAVAASSAVASVHTFYRNGGQMLDSGSLAAIMPAGRCDVYLCGPTPFMQRTWAALRQNAIAPEQIAHEFFGPLIDLERDYQSRA